jgi:hypothetical protein
VEAVVVDMIPLVQQAALALSLSEYLTILAQYSLVA